jgi:hypothetical protein
VGFLSNLSQSFLEANKEGGSRQHHRSLIAWLFGRTKKPKKHFWCDHFLLLLVLLVLQVLLVLLVLLLWTVPVAIGRVYEFWCHYRRPKKMMQYI